MLFMTQDAVPIDAYLIENLVRAMEEEEAATAYGRQLPDDTVGVIEHYTREFNYPAKSYVKSQKDLETMGIKTYFCSNVCAMYRKDVYEKMGGFVLLPFSMRYDYGIESDTGRILKCFMWQRRWLSMLINTLTGSSLREILIWQFPSASIMKFLMG